MGSSYVSVDKSYSALQSGAMYYLNLNERASGSSQKQAEIAGARQAGGEDAIGRMLAAILTEMRVEYYESIFDAQDERPRHNLIPMVEPWDVQKLLRESKGLYKEAERGAEQVVRDDLLDRLKAMIRDETLDAVMEERRRKRILAGEIEPTEADIDWLRQERDALAATVSPYDAVLAKVQG